MLHRTPSMFGKSLVMWRFGLRTVDIGGSLRIKLNLACHVGAKMSLALNAPE